MGDRGLAISDLWFSRMQEMWRKFGSIAVSGATIRNTKESLSIFIPPSERQINLPDGWALVQPGDPLTDSGSIVYGKYHGAIVAPPLDDVDLTTPLTDADIGIAGVAGECYVFNLAELYWDGGEDGAAQLDPVDSLIFFGRFHRAADDGKPIYLIDGFDPIPDCQDAT